MDKIDFLKIRYVCTSQDITITGNKQRVANRRTSVPRACLAKDAHPGGSAELRRPKGNGAVSKRAEAEQVSARRRKANTLRAICRKVIKLCRDIATSARRPKEKERTP